jgi:hypothetical protein
MDGLFDQDQGYIRNPLVQAAIEEFQVYANEWLVTRAFLISSQGAQRNYFPLPDLL